MKPIFQNFAAYRSPARRTGSTVIFMLVLLSVLATGMVTSLALTTGVSAQNTGQTFKRQVAFYAAEAGIQQAVWNMNNNATWLASLPLRQTLTNGASYTVSVVSANPSWPTTPLTFQSVGTSSDGTAVSRAFITVTSTYSVPGMAVGNNVQDSGTLIIAGTVQAIGNVTRSGTMTLTNVAGQGTADLQAMGSLTSSGSFTVPGDLQFNGSVTSSGTVHVGGSAEAGGAITHSGTWSIAGTTTPYDNPQLTINVPTVNSAALIAEAGTSGEIFPGGSYSSLTLDFTQTSGPDHVIYYSGNLSLSGSTKVIGSGTLVVNGKLTQSGTLGTLASPAPISIVTTDSADVTEDDADASMSGSLYITGALCVDGSLSKSGTTNVTGPVIIQNNLTGSGNVTINNGPAPSFIHFAGNGPGGAVTAQSNFTGPLY